MTPWGWNERGDEADKVVVHVTRISEPLSEICSLQLTSQYRKVAVLAAITVETSPLTIVKSGFGILSRSVAILKEVLLLEPNKSLPAPIQCVVIKHDDTVSF